eukprot:m.83841 g.83841  ORF g.83841 m.83841 type:complete len:397 (+) comp25678_c0_seq1:179-1369(+)
MTTMANVMDVLPVEINSKSAWQILTESIPKSEHEEIKRIIGEELVDEAEILHAEVVSLLDIWQDYRTRTESDLETIQTPSLAPLPEPPMVRDHLKQEIRFFLESLKKKGATIKRSTNASSGATSIIDYVLEKERPNSNPNVSTRPSTPRFDGRRPASCPRSKLTHTEVAALEEKLSIFNLGDATGKIRTAIRCECEALLKDAEFLQECLEGEHDYRSSLMPQTQQQRAPSLAELRGFRARLESKYFSQPTSSPKRPLSGSQPKPPRRPSRPLDSDITEKQRSTVKPPHRPPPQPDSATHDHSHNKHHPPSVPSRASSFSTGVNTDGSPRKARRASGVKMMMDADVSPIAPRPPPPRRAMGQTSQFNTNTHVPAASNSSAANKLRNVVHRARVADVV